MSFLHLFDKFYGTNPSIQFFATDKIILWKRLLKAA